MLILIGSASQIERAYAGAFLYRSKGKDRLALVALRGHQPEAARVHRGRGNYRSVAVPGGLGTVLEPATSGQGDRDVDLLSGGCH
jgi:hypothetical protein